jgi:tRNA G37 N-methylase Trm5
MLVANAWTVATSRALSRNARGIPTSYSSSKQINARALFHDTTAAATMTTRNNYFSSWDVPRNVPTKRSCRLFSTTTIAEGDNDCSSIAATTTTTATATTPPSTNNNNNNNFKDWKESPLVNPTITFETLLVPNSQLTKWITHPGLQHKLAKPDNWEFLKHVHPRIKLVQDYDDDEGTFASKITTTDSTNTHKGFKQLLLLPSSIVHATANHTATGMGMRMRMPSGGTGGEEVEDNDGWLSELLSLQGEDTTGETALIRKGPSRPMSISHNQLSFQYILKQLLPEAALPLPSSYEQIGHVAHFNLKEKHLPFKHLIGSVLLESTSGDSIQTVVNKVGKVDGKFRTYECEILANVFHTHDNNDVNASLETTVVEDGISIELNVAECYWCTRLSGERQELIRDILKGRKRPPKPKKGQPVVAAAAPQPPPLIIADAFCGAGAICMLLAKKIKDQDKAWKQEPNESKQQQQQQQQQHHPSLTILANDWNPKAIEYMKRSIATNGMDKAQDESLHHKFELYNKDSYDFLSKLGEEQQTTKANPYVKKILRKKKRVKTKEPPTDEDPEQQQDQQQQPSFMPDHVLMNFPLEAPHFLGALRWWSWKRLRDEGIKRTELYNDCYGGGKSAARSKSEWFPRFHVYTFARSSSPKTNDEDEMAVNLVANELLPQPFVDEETASDGDESTSSTLGDASPNPIVYRRDELNDECGTDFSTRIVRDVAPGKVVVCVSFSATPKLIRYMQGDYS